MASGLCDQYVIGRTEPPARQIEMQGAGRYAANQILGDWLPARPVLRARRRA
jgi:hypothetical protein